MKKKKLLRWGRLALLILAMGVACTFSVFAEGTDLAQQVQAANDAIQALTVDSSPEEWENAYQLLEQIPDEIATEEAALTGSMMDNWTGSVQQLFAQLQQQQAQQAKQQAQQYMQEIQKEQELQTTVSNYCNVARECGADAASKGEKQSMPNDMRAFLQQNNLFPSGVKPDDPKYSEEDWELIAASLAGYLERLGTDTQQQMVYIQDYMGSYNQYLQGANQQMEAASRSQTMLGGSSAGMTITSLLVGAVAGAVITLVVTRKRRKAA